MILYAVTIFIGAFLLFQAQPVIAKIILPWFGGSAAVWTTCLLFFQLVLVLGYLYAHALMRWVRPRAQAIVHCALLLASALALPIYPGAGWKPATPDAPIPKILGVLAATVGVPYFMLSTTGPLLQAWYARRRLGAMPYRLYALSNAGSMLALLSYPIAVEPMLATHRQAMVWSVAYGLFALLCGFIAYRERGAEGEHSTSLKEQVLSSATGSKNLGTNAETADMNVRATEGAAMPLEGQVLSSASGAKNLGTNAETADMNVRATGGAAAEQTGWRLYAMWLLLSACASALLLNVTSQLTLNVAAIPLLWVLPLSVYLLSFILCFERAGWYRRTPYLMLMGAALAAMAWATFGKNAGVLPIQVGIPLFLAGLFICSMTCHGELARLKPPPQRLTQFYLTVAAGGAAGGLMVGLAAPLLFNAYYEIPVGMVAIAGLALAAARIHPEAEWQRFLLPARRFVPALAAAAVVGFIAYSQWDALVAPAHAAVRWFRKGWQAPEEFDLWVLERELVLGAAIALAALRGDWKLSWARRWKQWAALLAELAALTLAGCVGFEMRYTTSGTLVMTRNFYGGLRVHDTGPATDWAATRSLTNGVINHGEQFLNPMRRDSPTTYFGPRSGIGLAIRAKQKAGPVRVGVIGLGTGAIASYGRTGDYFSYYEINPGVLALSTPGPGGASAWFTFLTDCKARHDVTLGDGRLSLERLSPQNFDVLAVDAFTSESVPVHLLTREAMQLYWRQLKPDGILAVNISNRFLEMEPLLDGEWRALGKMDRRVDNEDDDDANIFAASWMLGTAPGNGFDRSILDSSIEVKPGRLMRLWTDDYSNLFQILR